MIFAWLHPLFVDFFERLASFSRLILFDSEGLERPIGRGPCRRSRLKWMICVRFWTRRVRRKQRYSALITAVPSAPCSRRPTPKERRGLCFGTPGHVSSGSTEEHAAEVRRASSEWGRTDAIERAIAEQYPSRAGDESFRLMFATIARASASPGAAADFTRTVMETDISDVLPAIRVPTLVLYPQMERAALGGAGVLAGVDDDHALRVLDREGVDRERFRPLPVEDRMQ
jgi:hypothetical protein